MSSLAYRQKNLELLAAKQRAYTEKNRGKVLASKRRYRERNRQRLCVTERERRLASRAYVTPEELEACRQDPRKAKTIRGPDWIVCLECRGLFRQLGTHPVEEHHMSAAKYKAKCGYDRKTALMAMNLWQKVSRMRRRNRQGQWLKDYRPSVSKLIASRGPRRMRSEYRLNRRDAMKGKPRPDMWIATDVEIALLGLKGEQAGDIAKQVGLKHAPAVRARLRKMGWPRTWGGCLFDHGELVTGQHIRDLCSDFDKSQEEIADELGVAENTVGHRTTGSRLNRPLAVRLARRALAARERLKNQYSGKSAGPKGGRPRVLTPSEERIMRTQHPKLHADQARLKQWLEGLEGRVTSRTRERIWNWLCEQSRLGRIQVLLFWPEFFDWLQKVFKQSHLQSKPIARLGKPLTLAFLAHDFRVSVGKVIKTVWPAKDTEQPSQEAAASL